MVVRAFHNIPDGTPPDAVEQRMKDLEKGRMVCRVYVEACPPRHLSDGTYVDTRIVVEYHQRPADFKPPPQLDCIDYVR